MNPRLRKRILIVLASVLAVFLLLLAGIFVFRDSLLHKAIEKVADRMQADYDSKFAVGEAKFVGFSAIEMHQISLVPKAGDTLVSIRNFSTEINFWKLFTGNLQLGKLEVSEGFVQLKKDSTGRNFQKFLHPNNQKKPPASATGSSERTNYAKLGYKLLTRALNLVPTEMQVENVQLRILDMDRKLLMDLGTLSLADKNLNTDIRVTTNTMSQHWNISGFADPRERQTDLRFFSKDSGGIRLPYVDEKWNLKSGFDSIRLKVTDIDLDGDEMHVSGFSSIANLMVEHRRIASQPVVIKNADFDYKLMFGSDFMQIDSSSTARLNKIKFHPFAQYNVEQDTVYKLRVNIPKMQAQDFITSLPEGLFSHFEGMEAQGAFGYKLVFEYNKNKPNKVVFDSSLEKEGLKILKYGEANLSKLNGSFVYRAIEDGRRQRAVLVAPENIYYTPLDQISPYLRKAVLTTEDPSFFSHRGFISDAFRQSIVQNIKTKRFARGASTISMQLVKNVFLTREKTLSRKLEEILLVYIMENNHIVSKNRMLEVYFNIIEWGPNVYGIGEASLFYFLKHPSELNLNESLFLASIVPKPKKFMWQFDGEASLKPYLIKRNDYLKNLMLRRNLITPEDTVAQTRKVVLYGSARNYVKKEEEKVIDVDTLSIDEFDF